MKMNWYDLSKYRNQLYGLSMLWIVIFHVWESFKDLMDEKWSIIYIIRSGNYGVDLFLFLSGISMYFAIQRYVRCKGIELVHFYQRRLSKIVKVYVLFCIPYFVFLHLILEKDYVTFFQQVFFLRDHVSSFWFILCIIICYIIYPLLYKWMSKNKQWLVYLSLGTYVVGLFFMLRYIPDFYDKYEVLLSRIPVFVVGTLAGKKVFKKEEVHPYGALLAILLLLTKRPLFKVMKYIPMWNVYSVIFKRFYGSLIGVCVIVLFIMVLKYLEDTKVFDVLGKMGTFTLETYVFHIAYRKFLLSLPFIEIKSSLDVIWFLLLYTISSFVFAKILSVILSNIDRLFDRIFKRERYKL